MFRVVKNLKVVLGKGKGGGSKKTKKHERMQSIMVMKLQDCSKKEQYFETYHIGRT
jgi:hypothetical protein